MNLPTGPIEQLKAQAESSGASVTRLPVQRYALTDTGNAERFTAAHGDDFRYLHDRAHWLTFTGGRWTADTDGARVRAGKALAADLFREAAELPGEDGANLAKHALKLQSERGLAAMLKLAQSERPIATTSDAFDLHPHLMACTNGTVDLTAGELREADPNDSISLSTGIEFDPVAKCPTFDRFLSEVFDGDAALIDYMQKVFGYVATGENREHAFFTFHGGGANGKSTLVEVAGKALGEYSATASFESFMRLRGDRGPRDDIARLRGKRLVAASESGERRKFDEATVKNLTGGDTIAARPLYGTYAEFVPDFKLILSTNHLPSIDAADDAIWRRIRLIPFAQSFEGREDRELPAKLRDELPGILAWIVRGAARWYAEGLGEADAVKRATLDYRTEEDVLGAFVEERCTCSGDVPTADFYDAYMAYCADVGERPLTKGMVTKRLGKRGIANRSTNGARRYEGVSLR